MINFSKNTYISAEHSMNHLQKMYIVFVNIFSFSINNSFKINFKIVLNDKIS